MALRFTVQGDDEAETAVDLELLLTLGLATRMRPTLLTDDRWMARAVPRTTKAPAVEDDGRGSSVTSRELGVGQDSSVKHSQAARSRPV
jgi:hypothetical protein